MGTPKSSKTVSFDETPTEVPAPQHHGRRESLISIVYGVIEKTKKNLPSLADLRNMKSKKSSRAARVKGLINFRDSNFARALEHFNEALCWAPPKSKTMGSAYASRAAIYLHTGFYGLCMENIVLARANGYPWKKRKHLAKLEEKCKACQADPMKKDKMEKYSEPLPVPTPEVAMEKIPFACADLQFASDSTHGRYLTCRRDLKAGEVILNEKPYITVLMKQDVYAHCYHCGENSFFNLRPCALSTTAMFCSEKCFNVAFETYYKYEVEFIDALFAYLNEAPTMLAMRIFLTAYTMVDGKISELERIVKTVKKDGINPLNLDYTSNDKQSEYEKFRVLYSLETHANAMDIDTSSDLIDELAYVWYFLKEYTGLRYKMEKHEEFVVELLYHLARIVCINASTLATPFQVRAGDEELSRCQSTTYGAGIFLIFSFFLHSCRPSILRLPTDAHYACETIPANEPLCLSYLSVENTADPVVERRKVLRTYYYFECACIACVNNFSYDINAFADVLKVPEGVIPDEMNLPARTLLALSRLEESSTDAGCVNKRQVAKEIFDVVCLDMSEIPNDQVMLRVKMQWIGRFLMEEVYCHEKIDHILAGSWDKDLEPVMGLKRNKLLK